MLPGLQLFCPKIDIRLQSDWKIISGRNSHNYCGYELQSKDETWIICSIDSPHLPTHLTVPRIVTISGKTGKMAILHSTSSCTQAGCCGRHTHRNTGFTFAVFYMGGERLNRCWKTPWTGLARGKGALSYPRTWFRCYWLLPKNSIKNK